MRLTRSAACRTLVAGTLAFFIAAPAAAQPATVLDLLAQQKNLTTFVQAIHTAGLDDTLIGTGPMTIYAPTDDAFGKMPSADRNALMSSPDRLRGFLLGYIVKDAIKMQDGGNLLSSGKVVTASGRDIVFGLDERNRQTVGDAHLVKWDLQADNGRVNAIDKLLT